MSLNNADIIALNAVLLLWCVKTFCEQNYKDARKPVFCFMVTIMKIPPPPFFLKRSEYDPNGCFNQ